MFTSRARPFCCPRRRGIVQIWVVLMALMFVGFVGMAVDTGYGVLVNRQLQNAASAAALAGALQVLTDQNAARTAAVNTAAANSAAGASVVVDSNPSNSASGEVVLGNYDRNAATFSPTGTPVNAVQVTARRTTAAHGAVPLFFGSVFGVPTVDLSRSAIAMAQITPAPGLLILDPTGTGALSMTGSAGLSVVGGTIQVNSSAANAASLGGSTTVSAAQFNVVGTLNGSSHLQSGTTLTEGAAAVPDPLAGLPEPSTSGMVNFGGVTVGANQTQNLTPGYYSGGLNIKGTANLAPGIYAIDGAGLSMNSQGVLNAGGGVMLFIKGGGVDLSSNGLSITLTPPDPAVNTFPGASTYAGVGVFQSRTNSSAAQYTTNGTINVTGTFYYPRAAVTVTASGSADLARMIAYRLDVSGSGITTIHAANGGGQAATPFLVR